MRKRSDFGTSVGEAGVSFEDEFHLQLGRLVHETARFDFFVGLRLQWLGTQCGVDVSRYLEPTKVTLSARLDKLALLVRQAYGAAGPEVMAEFDAWFARVASVRALRNDYAHGRWGTPGRLEESPHGAGHPRVPMLAFVRLDWDMRPDRGDRSVYMSMEEFRGQVNDAVEVFAEFFKLCEKHLAFISPT